jgi:hypothetical protein
MYETPYAYPDTPPLLNSKARIMAGTKQSAVNDKLTPG